MWLPLCKNPLWQFMVDLLMNLHRHCVIRKNCWLARCLVGPALNALVNLVTMIASIKLVVMRSLKRWKKFQEKCVQLTCYRIEPSHWLYRLMSVCALCLAFCLPISISVYSIGLRLLVVFAFFILNFKDYCRQVFMNPLTGFILAFFCVLLLGQTYSHNVQYGWVDLHRYSKLICLPLLMPLFMNEKLRSKMIDAFVLGVSVVVLLTYLKVLHLYDYSPGALPGVGFTNHIDTSFVVALACFFVFRAIDWSQKQTYWRIAVFVFLTFYLFFINDGRMGYAVFMGLACLYCLQTFRLYYAAIAVVICLLFFFSMYYFFFPVHAVVNKGFQDFMQIGRAS